MVHISDEARQQGLNLIELQSDDAVKEPVWNTLEANDALFVNGFGHGNVGIFTGDTTEAIFTNAECSILAGRVVYLLSCFTAVQLGPAVINAGGITYIGFNISWTWLAQNITADPYDDWYAEGFYRSSNEFPIALIQGAIVSAAKDRSIAEYNRWIEIWETGRASDPLAADAISWLLYDRDGLTVLGDQSATVALEGEQEDNPMANLISTSVISTSTGYGMQRKLVRLSDGTLYAVYIKQLAGLNQIYVKKSTDNGASWTDETRISTYEGMENNNQNFPSIAVDSNDYLHVVWGGGTTVGYPTHDQVWYNKFTTSWAGPLRISTYENMDNFDQDAPSIAVDSNDYLHVVWGGRATGHLIAAQIWHNKFTTSWAGPVWISTGMANYGQYRPSIAVDSNDYLHVVWYGSLFGFQTGYQLWYNKFTTSWAGPLRISTYEGMETASHQNYPSIAVDSNDYLYVVWQGKATGYLTDNQVWCNKFTTSWAGPERISTYEGMENHDQNFPSIAVDSNDYLHVVWGGRATGYTDFNKVWYAKYETSWATPECLQATGQNEYPNARWSRYPSSNIPHAGFDYVFTGQSSPANIYYAPKDSPLPPSAPTVTTQAATDVGTTTATGNGNITDNGGEDCDKRGFVYGPSSHGDPGNTAPAASDYADYVEETNGFGIGAFTGALTGLEPKTPYYVRAYAHNSGGYSYGAEVSFTTLATTPTVTTNPATEVGQTTATLNGELAADGGEACECGFEYGETTGYGSTTATQSKTTGETFSQEVRGLMSGRVYHFRAMATNSAGTGYGADRTFHTEALSAEAHQALGRHFSMGRHGL